MTPTPAGEAAAYYKLPINTAAGKYSHSPSLHPLHSIGGISPHAIPPHLSKLPPKRGLKNVFRLMGQNTYNCYIVQYCMVGFE
jgi:hypothetical protein